jgi:putative sterol carrier protein/fido (protein-threonine AMPylation protein)
MLEETTSKISGYGQLKKLRTALAISQGRKLISTLQYEARRTISHDQTKRVTYLTSLFSRIHRELFHHWKEQATVNHRPGTMLDADKRKKFRKAVARLVLDDDSNQDSAIFDNNGFVINTENIAERLADFYVLMRNIRPFSYGNRITLDFFMTVLGMMPAFKSVYEQGIDFRRITATDAEAMHDLDSSNRQVAIAFQHALDPSRNKGLNNKANGYGEWPENKKFISGIPFLSHITDNGVECLVSVNGGLLPYERIKQEIISAGKHLADYPLSAAKNIIGYLPGTEALREPGKIDIDGIPIGEGGAAPLFCLDINMLTGMRSISHAELIELLIQCSGENAKIFDLANNEFLKNKMVAAADGDSRLERTVEIAYQRLSKMASKIENIKQAVFTGKTVDLNPKMFMCMGGAGAGKTAVEEIAKAQCGDNFVTASLDEFRKESDLYQVLTAASHHSDDYVYVEPFANRLRDEVADYARTHNINLLYDGTGIPYQPRYANIVEQFKRANFHTQITAVDAFLVKPEGREQELSRSCVIESVKARFEKTGRALPWVITVYKHVRAPRSFLYAMEDKSLDKISLFANDGEMNKHYLVAESFDFSDSELKALQNYQRNGSLVEHLTLLVRDQQDSVLKTLAEGSPDNLNELMARNVHMEEQNVAYLVSYGQETNRVLAIYNTQRLVDFVEKRQLNSNASGEEGLLHKPESMAFHVDPLSKEPWKTRLQGSSTS